MDEQQQAPPASEVAPNKKTSHAEANKRIVKNTLALYFRQIITMGVSLYTSRIVLRTLGVEDFGINNVVGGVVAMLSFLTGSLSNTTQRFLNVEMGKGDTAKLKQIFANSLSLHAIFIAIVIILAETVGLWFLQTKLVIPPERATAAFWVFQFSVISFAISVFFAPFDGAIKAHEKFSFYAKMSIFDVIMKLGLAFAIVYTPYDKLIMWALMVKCVLIVGKIIIYVYCRRNFEECRIRLAWKSDCVRGLVGYNAYVVILSATWIAKTHGLNIVLNMFYGPVLNTAQGIANQIKNALYSFSNNALIATQPQIIQSHAQNDKKRLWDLITQSSRLYFYLLLIITLPIILEIDTALYFWLGIYPEYTTVFARILLLDALIRVIHTPLEYVNQATKKLGAYTIIWSVCRTLVLASAVFIGMKGFEPTYIYVSYIVWQIFGTFMVVVFTMKTQLIISIRKYVFDVVLPISKTSLFVASLPIVLHCFFSKSTLSSCGVGILTILWSAIIIFFVGLNKLEKKGIINKLPLSLRHKLYCLVQGNEIR